MIHNSKTKYLWLCWILLLTNRLEKKFHFWNFFKILFSVFLMFDVRDVGIMNQLSNTDRTSNFWIFWCVSKKFFLNISSSVFGAETVWSSADYAIGTPCIPHKTSKKWQNIPTMKFHSSGDDFYSFRFLSSEKCPTERSHARVYT